MSKELSDNRFYCSFCEQSLGITPTHVSRRIRCPKCKRTVWVYPNRNRSIDSQLASSWRYKKLRLLVGYDVIGPIPSEQFLALCEAGKIPADTDVASPEFTRDHWVELRQVHLPVVKARVEQRAAERTREANFKNRQEATLQVNRDRLRRAIASAIADGQVTFRERSQIVDFATRAKIPIADVDELLQRESRELLNSIVEEALEDGILEPHERERIGDLATGLGIRLDLTPDQHHQFHLCDLAYRLAVGESVSCCDVDGSVQLNATERPIHRARFEWHEVVQLKRAAGIPLGNGHFLKHVASGDCILTDKRVLLVGELAARKVMLSSVAKVSWFADGILFNRSSGKSVFVRPLPPLLDCDQWAMLAVHAITREPVQGIRPSTYFIPEATVEAASEPRRWESHCEIDEPRYTFRVVGDHVGDRGYWVDQLNVGDPIRLRREPNNPYDPNAVAVFDNKGRQLGYLKRDVAVWFAPILDRGRSFTYDAYRKPASGGLIIGVYEIK